MHVDYSVLSTRCCVMLGFCLRLSTHRMLMNSKWMQLFCGGFQSVPKPVAHDFPSGSPLPPSHRWDVSSGGFLSGFCCRDQNWWLEPDLKPSMLQTSVCYFSFKQKYLLSNPAHQSGAVDEHFFLNESAAQVRYAQLCCWYVTGVTQPQKLMLSSRDITQFKPLSSRTSVTVITGDRFDHEIPDQLNQVSGPKRHAVET